MTAEQFLAGSILIEGGIVSSVRGLVCPSDFASDACRVIYSAALCLADEGQIVDPVTVQEHARRDGVDLPYQLLADLMACVPTAAHAAEYARQVAEESRRRQIHSLASQIQANEQATADELLAEMRDGVASIGQPSATGLIDPMESLRRFTDYAAAMESGGMNFIPSRFSRLDSMLGGGFIRGGLYVIGARPGVGKTSFAVNLADKIRGGVLFVSLEMSAEQVVAKRFARVTGIPSKKLLSGNLSDGEWDQVGAATTRLAASGVYLNQRHTLTVRDIEMLARNVPDLRAVIIDYLGLVEPSTATASTYERSTQISRDLKLLALALNVPVLCLAQLNRGVEARENKQPRLSDLRDSGAIEQDADGVLLLFRPDYYDMVEADSSVVTVTLAKNRHGSTGRTEFLFFRDLSGFREREVKEHG